MTTLDPGATGATDAERLTQIRERHERKRASHDMLAKPDPARHTGHPGDGALQRLQTYAVQAASSADDVPWLLDQVKRLSGDYEARGNRIESLKREATQVSLVARRTADENDKLKAANANLIGNARVLADELIHAQAANDRLLPVVEAAKDAVEVWRQWDRAVRDMELEPPPIPMSELAAAVDALGTDAADGAGTGEHPAWLIDLVNAAVLTQEAEDECDWTPQGNCTEECAWCGWERLLEALPADVRDAAHRHLNHEPAASPAGSSTADEEAAR